MLQHSQVLQVLCLALSPKHESRGSHWVWQERPRTGHLKACGPAVEVEARCCLDPSGRSWVSSHSTRVP